MSPSILQQFKLDSHVALIVGGNRGLGLEIAKALAEAGASIAIAARDHRRNDESRTLITGQFGRECITAVCDVTVPEQVNAAVAATVAKFDKIDILVNSAGINIRGPIGQLSPEEFEPVPPVNPTPPFLSPP